MRYLKSYKLFESNNNGTGNASFDWLRKKNNEDYIELMHILQSEVFDEFNIISKSDESFGDIDPWEEGYPNHSFWVFRPVAKGHTSTTDDDFSDVNLVDNHEVKEMIVYNIEKEDKERFYNLLLEVRDIVKSYLNKDMVISEEHHETSGNFDYVIKLENIKSPQTHTT